MRHHTLKIPGTDCVVRADYDSESCVLTAATPEVIQARDALAQIVRGLSLPVLARMGVLQILHRVLPARVTEVSEYRFMFANARVSPELVQVTFRMQPEQFQQHLLKYEVHTHG